jgi:hypothetical protein
VFSVGGKLLGPSMHYLVQNPEVDTRNVYVSQKHAFKIYSTFFSDAHPSQKLLWQKIQDNMQAINGMKVRLSLSPSPGQTHLRYYIFEFAAGRVPRGQGG